MSNKTPLSAMRLKRLVKNYFDGLGHLIFSNFCFHCNSELTNGEDYLCWLCWEGLDRTHFEQASSPTNLDQLFWGRAKIQYCCALYYYSKDSVCSSLIGALKYKSKAPLGIYLGKHLAQVMNKHPIRNVDALVALPIHSKKRFQRGYNQSELIAKGLSLEWRIPLIQGAAHKKKNTKSQTQNDRFERWENVKNTFEINTQQLVFNHILIVDDVITTGATLEALCQSIHRAAPDIQISLLSFAFTK